MDLEDAEVFDLRGKKLKALKDLEELKNLKILDASCNELSRISGIGNNEELRVLKLYGNHIKVIENLDKLCQLHTLLLHDNKITAIGKGLMYCHKLQVLRLDHNQLGGVWTGVELASCAAHLKELNLSYNSLIGVEAVASLPNLTDLNLAGNRLQLVPDFSQCSKLITLNMSSNPLQSCSLSKLNAPKLKILHLASIKLVTISHLPFLGFLQELHLSHNHLSSLDKCHTLFPSLEVLDIRWNKLQSLETLYPLSKAQRLTELMVQGNEFSSDEETVYSCIRKVLPNIEVVDSHVIMASTYLSTTETDTELVTMTSPDLKEIEQALEESDAMLENYSSQIKATFKLLQSDEGSLQLPRQPSRSGNRARLEEALEFAAHSL